jgi:hypothetical protein
MLKSLLVLKIGLLLFGSTVRLPGNVTAPLESKVQVLPVPSVIMLKSLLVLKIGLLLFGSTVRLPGNVTAPLAPNTHVAVLVPVVAMTVTSVPVPPPLITGVAAGSVSTPSVPNVQVLVVAVVTVSM